MAKKIKKSRRQGDEAFAIGRHIRGSGQKLNLVAKLIRGLPVQRALVELQFCRRRMAKNVREVLESAIANAENNHNLDVDRLFVKEATVGVTLTMRRFRARAKGRSSSIDKPFSNLTIFVEERDVEEKPKKAKKTVKEEVAEEKKPAAKKKAATKAAPKAAKKKDDSASAE